MREYETTFIVQPEISDEGCVELFARVDGVLERAGATRLLHDDQGKRRLAYEIRKFQKGRYVTTYYLSGGEAVGPLERALQIEESVLRFLTVLRTEEVADIEARRAEAAEEERIRLERAKERAEREAAEEQARQEAATARAAEAEAAGGESAEGAGAEAGEAAPGEAAGVESGAESAAPAEAAEVAGADSAPAESGSEAAAGDGGAQEAQS